MFYSIYGVRRNLPGTPARNASSTVLQLRPGWHGSSGALVAGGASARTAVRISCRNGYELTCFGLKLPCFGASNRASFLEPFSKLSRVTSGGGGTGSRVVKGEVRRRWGEIPALA